MEDEYRVFRLLAAVGAALAITVAAAAAAIAADVSISLPTSIEVRDGGFCLGEYASIEGDGELAAAVSMAWISPTGRSLTRDDVVAALGRTSAAGQSVALRMPSKVEIRPESRLAAELRAMSGWKWRIDAVCDEIDDATQFKLPPRVAPGARSVTAKTPGKSGQLGNRMVKLKWYQPIVRTKRALARGQMIDANALEVKIGTVQMNDDFAWDAASLRGSAPRHAIASGMPVQLSAMDRVHVIKNGASVRIVSSVNGLGVEMSGIAMQRGGIGDMIKVKNLSSKKTLRARVVDSERVFVE